MSGSSVDRASSRSAGAGADGSGRYHSSSAAATAPRASVGVAFAPNGMREPSGSGVAMGGTPQRQVTVTISIGSARPFRVTDRGSETV